MLIAKVRNLIFTISVPGDEQFIRKILSSYLSFIIRSTILKRSTSRIFTSPSFSYASRVRSLDPAYLEQVLCIESITNQLIEDVTRTARLKFYMLIILERRPNDKRINIDAIESFKRLQEQAFIYNDALFEPAVLSNVDVGNISQRKWYAFSTATRDTFITSKSKTSKAIYSRLKALNDSILLLYEPIINIAIAARSIDALYSNALLQSYVRTIYLKLAFTVIHLHPSDSNRDYLEPYLATQDI